MANLDNVRLFVIDALKKYHAGLTSANDYALAQTLQDYVQKETGKGLSSNDFTNSYMSKLDGIAAGAEVNVQSDWNVSDTSSDAYILNKPSLTGFIDYANYDSTIHQIVFKNGGASGTQITTVDCSDFIIDGMIDSVSIENYTGDDIATYGTSYLFIDFNTDAEGNNLNGSHTDIKIPLTRIFNPNNYYNKTDIDGLLNDKVDVVSGKQLSTEDFTTAYMTKLDGIAANAQVNVIESVKVNGTALTVSNKAVDVTVPTALSDLTNDDNYVQDANYTHTDNNYTTTEKTKLSGIAEGAQVNVIEEVQLNGTALQVTNKSVNVVIPAAATVSFTGTKSSDAGDYTYVANGFSADDHQITVSYTGVLKQHQDISGKEDTTNKKTDLTLAANISNTYYPSTSAVVTYVNTYVGSLAELTTSELNDIFGISGS